MADPPIPIVHLITTLDVGGAEMALLQLATRSDPTRFAHHVVVLKPAGAVGPKLERARIPVHSLEMDPALRSAIHLPRLVHVLRSLRPAVLHTWLYHADLMGLVAGRLARVPSIIWNLRASDLDLSAHPRWTRATRAACATLSRFATAAVVNSEAGLAFHRRLGYRPAAWHVIPNGVDTERFRPDPDARSSVRKELGLGAEDPIVGLVARDDPVKDHPTFLRAAALLVSTHPSARFVLIGRGIDGRNRALADLVSTLGLEPRVRLLGERDDVPRLTASFDVASLTSTSEGFPNVVLEALACGVPCVATDVGDARTIIDGAGEIVPPRDAAALAAGWRRWLDRGPQARRRAGDAARARIGRDYSLERLVQRYERLYAPTRAASPDGP